MYIIAVALATIHCTIYFVLVRPLHSQGQVAMTALTCVLLVYAAVGSFFSVIISSQQSHKHRTSGSWPTPEVEKLFKRLYYCHIIAMLVAFSGIIAPPICIFFKGARNGIWYRSTATIVCYTTNLTAPTNYSQVTVGAQGVCTACFRYNAIERWVGRFALGSDIEFQRNTRPAG